MKKNNKIIKYENQIEIFKSDNIYDDIKKFDSFYNSILNIDEKESCSIHFNNDSNLELEKENTKQIISNNETKQIISNNEIKKLELETKQIISNNEVRKLELEIELIKLKSRILKNNK